MDTAPDKQDTAPPATDPKAAETNDRKDAEAKPDSAIAATAEVKAEVKPEASNGASTAATDAANGTAASLDAMLKQPVDEDTLRAATLAATQAASEKAKVCHLLSHCSCLHPTPVYRS